jgi:hypothetical protein
VAGGDRDPNGLVETVRDDGELHELGAEPYMTSCIVGEVAYDVQPGFIGEPVGG